MNIYSLFELFPESKSIAVAALYGINDEKLEFQLSEFIKIVPSNEIIDTFYLPLSNNALSKPSHYLIGYANDKRYIYPERTLSDSADSRSSLTLAQLCLSIYYSSPFYIGSIICFCSEVGYSPLIISRANIPGSHHELSDDMLTIPHSPFFGSRIYDSTLNDELTNFFKDIANSYFNKNDKRWIFSAIKYLSGITQMYAHDVIIDFSISLESLLSVDKESIGLKLRLYSSLLIGSNYSERIQIHNDIKEFYNLRSSIVHGNFSNIKDKEIILIRRIGTYLSKLLKITCGKNIKKDIYPNLEYLSLLGAPRYSRENYSLIITENDIIETIEALIDEKIGSYEFYMDDDDDFLSANDLLIKTTINGNEQEPFYAGFYLHDVPAMKNLNNISYWISKDDNGKYIIIVNSKT